MSVFDKAERWDVSTDTMLPVGNHVVTIVEVEGETSRSGSNPQIVLRFENSQGVIRDWLTYHDQLLGKVASLYDAAGIQVPQEGEYDPADKCRLTDKCIRRLLNKKVGIVIREEPDNRDPSKPKMRREVKGYVTTDHPAFTGDAPADTSGLSTIGVGAAADEDIPF